MKKKKKVWIIGGGIVVGGLLLVGILGQNSKKNAVTLVGPTDANQVQVGKAVKGDILTKVSSSGVLYAEVEETIFSDSANQVKNIEKEVGDSVKAGDIVFVLDEETRTTLQKEIEKINLNIANAKLSLQQLQNASTQEVLQAQTSLKDLDKAELDTKEAIRSAKENIRLSEMDVQTLEKQYVLTQSLFETGLASQAELDQAKKDVDALNEKMTSLENQQVSLEKSLSTLELQKENANYQLSVLLNEVQDEKKNQNIEMRQNEIKTLELQKADLVKDLDEFTDTVTAPIAGIISEVMVEEGAYFGQGTPLVKIINTDKLMVKSDISPFYASQLEEGLEADLKFKGSQTIEFVGKVTKVSPTASTTVAANGTSTTIPVEIEVVEQIEELKPGLTIDVRIITNDIKDVVTVPILATMEDDEGQTYVFVVREDFTLEKRDVKSGVADNQVIQIDGISEGEIVVTNPTEALEEGMSVQYLPFLEE